MTEYPKHVVPESERLPFSDKDARDYADEICEVTDRGFTRRKGRGMTARDASLLRTAIIPKNMEDFRDGKIGINEVRRRCLNDLIGLSY